MSEDDSSELPTFDAVNLQYRTKGLVNSGFQRAYVVLEALDEAGISKDAVVRSGGALDYQRGLEIGLNGVADFDALETNPTAVIATSDDMAISFMSSMRKLGWNIPGDLSIVSFDVSPRPANFPEQSG